MIGNMPTKDKSVLRWPAQQPKQHTSPGFSLLEIVVAAALFSVIMVAVVNLFVIFLRRPLQQIDEYHVYEEVNNALWELNRLTYSEKIDYTTYGTISNPETDLYLVATDNSETVHIYLSSGQLFATIVDAGGTDTIALTSSSNEVYIDTFSVYVYPSLDPFIIANATNSQPAVVIQIVAHSVSNPAVTFTAQTLITTRVYER